MVILRKRLPGEAPGDQSWLETTTVPDPAGGEPIPVNKYFAQNPHMILGTLDRTGTMRAKDQKNVSRTEDYHDRLAKALAALPKNVLATNSAPAARFAPEALPAPADVKRGGYAVKDGKVFVRAAEGLVPHTVSAPVAAKIAGHLSVLGAFRALIKAETAGADATAERAALNTAYDAFVKKHGPLNAPANKRAFASPDDSPPLLALENYDKKTKTATKADIFTKPVVSAAAPVTKVGSVSEGVGVSLHETGSLDVNRIAKLTGKTPDAVGRELLDGGLAYEDPSHGWQPADQYLSGNVRQKLAAARAAAAADPKYAPNVAALEKVQPEDIHQDDIGVKLGAPWVPPSDVAAFAGHVCGADPEAFAVARTPGTGEWHAGYGKHWQAKTLAKSRTTNNVWGAGGANFTELLASALNGQAVTITRPIPGGEGKREVDKEATEAANAKVQEIKDEFKNWVWTDPERRDRLHRHYNDNFNNVRPIKYDGSHLKFPGSNPAIRLRPHQKNFVWQVVTTGKGLAGHEVGTGKTFSMIAAAMELRRLGLARKPASCARRPTWRRSPGTRSAAVPRGQDPLDRRHVRRQEPQGDHFEDRHRRLRHGHHDARPPRPRDAPGDAEEVHPRGDRRTGGRQGGLGDKKEDERTAKELEKARQNLLAKLQKAIDAEGKDEQVSFEDLGVDHLFVDEAHRYKTLPTYTKRRGMKGINTGRSQRATNMLMRARWLMENNGGRGLTFLTGTPVTNTMGELYTMQKYLQPEDLKARGIDTFDGWASTFGDEETKMEKTATGVYKPVTRFSKFINLPELKQISGQMLDVQRADDLKNPDGTPTVPRPTRKDFVHVAPKSEHVERMMKELQERASQLRGKAVKGGDNMLSISTDGRKGSVDMRMLYGDAPDDPDSKTNKLVENVLAISKKNPGKTQMIFSDIGVHAQKPKGAGAAEGDEADLDAAADAESGVNADADLASRTSFHLYGDLIDKLVAGGIPRDKIADFSALEGAKKEEAIDGLKRGDVLVGLGSTEKIGTGVNAQDKLLALHHLDCPWRPADLEQRDGRGWRNGNENKDVQIHRYVTEGSLDELFWQGIARKAHFIKQVLAPGASVAREMKEEDTDELTPEQIMAAASGDPRILEKVQTDEDVRALGGAETRHKREQTAFAGQLRDADARAREHRENIEDFRRTIADLAARPDFELKVGGETFADRKDGLAAAALEKRVAEAGSYNATVGHYRGLRIVKDGGRVYLETPGGRRVFTNGTLASVEARARNLDGELASHEGALAQHEKDVAQVREKAGKPFPKADELAKKLARQKELEAALAGTDKEKPEGEGAGG
jgi:N12 class adenine-specific DNA methylase